jgi:hypothetical protein
MAPSTTSRTGTGPSISPFNAGGVIRNATHRVVLTAGFRQISLSRGSEPPRRAEAAPGGGSQGQQERRVLGAYDDISAEQLQSDLIDFARAILKSSEEDRVLESPASLLKILGELRQKLFAFEIRSTRLKLPSSDPSRTPEADESSRPDAPSAHGGEGGSALNDSLRIVQEALRRTQSMLEELDQGTEPPESE